MSAAQSTLSLSLATAGLGAALLVAGPASEVLGRTGLIRLSLIASAVVALACAAAPGWDWLLILRLAQGITLAGLPAAATAYLREELHPDTYARAAGLYIGGTALGGMAGRLLTGAVAGAAGWRWALAAVALLGLICAGIVALTLPPSRNFSPRARPAPPAGADDQARPIRPRAARALRRSAPAPWARSWPSTTRWGSGLPPRRCA